jgi:hypothetical protein
MVNRHFSRKIIGLNSILSEEFPRAYSFSSSEDVYVQKFLSARRLADNFHLPLSPEALEDVRNIQRNTTHILLQDGSHDKWNYAWVQIFIPREIMPHVSISWLRKRKCIPKMKFFCWLILMDRLNNINMLRRRQYILDSGYNCLLCASPPEETIEHLLFHCDFSTECWSTLNISWQQTGGRCQIIEQGKSQWTGPMFMEIFIVAAWNIWKERNNLLFNNVTPHVDSWKRRFKSDFSMLVHRTKETLHPFIHSFSNSL